MSWLRTVPCPHCRWPCCLQPDFFLDEARLIARQEPIARTHTAGLDAAEAGTCGGQAARGGVQEQALEPVQAQINEQHLRDIRAQVRLLMARRGGAPADRPTTGLDLGCVQEPGR